MKKTKHCTKCGKLKPLSGFSRNKTHKDGLQSQCKACEAEYGYEYRKTNREKKAKYQREWYKANREKKAKYKRKWCKANPEKKAKYQRTRRAKDVQCRLADNLRGRLYGAIKGKPKNGSAVRDLGCSIAELKEYLEGKFGDGMSWDNWGRNGWHIDHIRPLSSFDLTDPDQLKEACHYTNLQPLWAKDNLQKHNKVLAEQPDICGGIRR